MTFTGIAQLAFAHELPAAVDPVWSDTWLRTDTGDQVLVQTATRTGDTITVTAEVINWPRPNTTITINLPADIRISARVY